MIRFSVNAPAEAAITIHLIDHTEDLSAAALSEAEAAYVQDAVAREQSLMPVNRYSEMSYVYFIKEKKDNTAHC